MEGASLHAGGSSPVRSSCTKTAKGGCNWRSWADLSDARDDAVYVDPACVWTNYYAECPNDENEGEKINEMEGLVKAYELDLAPGFVGAHRLSSPPLGLWRDCGGDPVRLPS